MKHNPYCQERQEHETQIILDLLALYRREGESAATLDKLRELRHWRQERTRRTHAH